MNICSEAHTPTLKIIYKGAKCSDYQPEWLVCENCHEKRYFGTLEDIISIVPLKWYCSYSIDLEWEFEMKPWFKYFSLP